MNIEQRPLTDEERAFLEHLLPPDDVQRCDCGDPCCGVEPPNYYGLSGEAPAEPSWTGDDDR